MNQDNDIRDFITSCDKSMTYSEIEHAIRERFGEERAWSHTRIVNFWQTVKFTKKGYASRLDRDAELRAFVDERLHRLTLAELVDACRERFGVERAPSHSGLGRYSQRVRRAPSKRMAGASLPDAAGSPPGR